MLLGACSGAATDAIDIALVPDLNLNSPQQLVERIAHVLLVVDADGGLSPPGAEQRGAAVSIIDADDDPTDLELVARVPVEGALPLTRLQRGGLPDRPLRLRVLGVARSAEGEERSKKVSPVVCGRRARPAR